MGLLSLGTPLAWSEAQKHADHVRKHGIVQFINTWNRVKSRKRDHLLWGDEVPKGIETESDGSADKSIARGKVNELPHPF